MRRTEDKDGKVGLAARLLGKLEWYFQNVFLLFRQDFKEILFFILGCSVLSLVGTSALTRATTWLLMRFSGTTYIAPANLALILTNPLNVVTLVIEQVLGTLVALFQIAGLLHAFSMAQIGRETTLGSMFFAGLRVCRKALRPKNWPVVLFILVLMPLTKVMALASTSYKLIIPGFINQTIEYTAMYRVLYQVLYLGIVSFVMLYVFTINYFVLSDDDFIKSCSKARRLGKGRRVQTMLFLGIMILLVNAVINFVASGITVNVSEVVAFFTGGKGTAVRSAQVGSYVYALRTVLVGFLVPALNNAGLTVLFYRYLDDSEQVATLSREVFRTRVLSVRTKRVLVGIAVAAVIGGCGYAIHHYAFLAEPVGRPMVCAHRGDNVNAPENTMPAFELAFSENLPWIELDVHQTSDNVIVCSHDASIGRVTGHDLKICEHTYDELVQYEMGDWMPGGVYGGVTIPKLEEVLTSARERGVNVQVELKGSKDDVDFEKHVLEVINACGMHDNVMVIGQDAQRMQRVAELDPTITKGYCMFVAQGHVEDIPYTDNVTIEETNVTPELVDRLHKKGVKVFCWTVDLDDTVQYLVSCGVDVIGTDDPLLISAALDHADYSGGLVRFFYIVLNTVSAMAR
ncbi:MAG: glycerophosphoryl diester phosphodiesterase membrane domain-containing protein [Atopobiaceae bacterium]|nr:glycerophosphoryl diester phosphodiesterase membrane domain-containing protein [Atopobiaceae bacterium]